jgi:predicted NBD/HSP70 family sugar kinase
MTDKQIPLQKHLSIVSDLKRKLDEALAQGREWFQQYVDANEAALEARAKAIDEAAKVVIDAAAIVDHPSVYMGGPTRHAKWVAQQFADAILALKDKP